MSSHPRKDRPRSTINSRINLTLITVKGLNKRSLALRRCCPALQACTSVCLWPCEQLRPEVCTLVCLQPCERLRPEACTSVCLSPCQRSTGRNRCISVKVLRSLHFVLLPLASLHRMPVTLSALHVVFLSTFTPLYVVLWHQSVWETPWPFLSLESSRVSLACGTDIP